MKYVAFDHVSSTPLCEGTLTQCKKYRDSQKYSLWITTEEVYNFLSEVYWDWVNKEEETEKKHSWLFSNGVFMWEKVLLDMPITY